MRISFRLGVAGTFLAMVAVNALAALLPINGVTPGEVSDAYPNLFAPAGITFSIWSVIYLLLAAHTLYQCGVWQQPIAREKTEVLHRVGVWFSVSSLVNAAWIFAWHYRVLWLSLLLMLTLLVCLIRIMEMINKETLSQREKWLVRLPFSVYFGWITVAAIANVTTLLVSLGWNGFGVAESTWTILALAVGMLVGIAALLRFGIVAYGVVLVWAYGGIWLKHTAADGFAGAYPSVITTVLLCMGLFAGAIACVLFRKRRENLLGR